MEVANLQHGGGVAEDEINGALQPCRVGKGMPEVEWSYLDSIAGMIFEFLRIAVTAFGFFFSSFHVCLLWWNYLR